LGIAQVTLSPISDFGGRENAAAEGGERNVDNKVPKVKKKGKHHQKSQVPQQSPRRTSARKGKLGLALAAKRTVQRIAGETN